MGSEIPELDLQVKDLLSITSIAIFYEKNKLFQILNNFRNEEEKIKREEQKKVLVELEAENEKKRAEEQAYAAEAMLKVYKNVDTKLLEALALVKGDPGILMAKAFLEIGENADRVGNLNITPDLLQSILQGGNVGNY